MRRFAQKHGQVLALAQMGTMVALSLLQLKELREIKNSLRDSKK